MASGEGNYKITPTTTVTAAGTEELLGKTLKESFGEVSVTPSTETTITSLTVAVGKILRLRGVYAEMDADAIFRIFLNGTKKWQARNAWTDRNVSAQIEIEATAGDVISLKVIHSRPLTHTASGHIYAYER